MLGADESDKRNLDEKHTAVRSYSIVLRTIPP